ASDRLRKPRLTERARAGTLEELRTRRTNSNASARFCGRGVESIRGKMQKPSDDKLSPDTIDPAALCRRAEQCGLDVVLIRIDTEPRAILFRERTPRGRAVERGLG